MYGLFVFAFTFCKICLYEPPQNFCLQQVNIGIKNAEFHVDFKFVYSDFKKCPEIYAKNLENCA